jgi:hypothetical protein
MTELNSFYDYVLSLSEAKTKISEFDIIYSKIVTVLHTPVSSVFAEWLERFKKGRQLVPLFRLDEQYTEYQRQENSLERLDMKDRVFPLETVSLQRYRTDNDADIDTAIIHTGPYADELARSMNALAIAIAGDIYFRNGAYRPESEEGRKTLTHELTHVAQYEEGRTRDTASVKELEEEAVAVERQEEYNADPYCTIEIGRKLCRIKKSEIDRFAGELADAIEGSIVREKNKLGEEDYLKLLAGYETWLKGGVPSGLIGA